ncbi:hypothetical protein [Xanthomonas prunicola]|uniref:Uncharacterized protein n=1 Tax=Xanthomonas prunicola TaxID=2053930 RepID=A0A9Q9J078_9XANT|nr:hypothetical protein [Xanthomonas prunicola]UXA64507.1 hypothetical protein M0D43_16370 [Xanthomonas prunicola]
MRDADANCVALTRVGEITDSARDASAQHERIALIPRDFFLHRCAAAQQA